MAYVTTATAPSFLARMGAGVEGLISRYRKFRLYRETVDGLNALSNRELADLGLSRAEIRAAAEQATYR